MMSNYLNVPFKDYSNNLIAKWVFDDTDTSKVNGSTIYDLSGNGNNLTAYNLSFIDDPDMGRCAYFNGSSSYCSNSRMKIPVGTKSVIFKIKPINTSNYEFIINSGDVHSVGHDIYINNKGLLTCNHRKNGFGNTTQKIDFGNWYDYKYTYDQKDISMFINDNLITPNVSFETSIDTANSAGIFNIGKAYNTNYFFKGYIKYIEIYNTVVDHHDTSYLIEDGGNIYSFKKDEYSNGTYNEITNTLSKDIFFEKGEPDISSLFKPININDETFKPIDKFSSPKIISYKDKSLKINGIKSSSELVISKQSLSSIMATNIHKFLLDSSISGNANILTVVSDDNGATWKYYKNNTWNTMTNHIDCDVNYNNMSDEQKQTWDNFKTEIITNNSMTPEELESADFELLRNGNKNTKFRFGFVIIQQDIDSKSQLKAIKINEDKDGGYNELSTEQINVNINYGYITLTPKENFDDKVLVNLQAIKQDNTPSTVIISDK